MLSVEITLNHGAYPISITPREQFNDYTWRFLSSMILCLHFWRFHDCYFSTVGTCRCQLYCYFSTVEKFRCQLYCWLLLQYCWNMSVAVVLLAVTSVLLKHVGVICTVGCYFSTAGTCRCQLQPTVQLTPTCSNSTEVTTNSTTTTDMFQQFWSNSQ
jgi:hypothetical protein